MARRKNVKEEIKSVEGDFDVSAEEGSLEEVENLFDTDLDSLRDD